MQHADYVVKLQSLIDRAGKHNGTKPPQSNDAVDALAQEYAIAKALADAADSRVERARTALMKGMQLPERKGQHILHDTQFALVEDQVVSNARLIKPAMLLNALVTECGMTLTQADEFIDRHCKPADAGMQHRLKVLLKQ